MKEIEKKWMFNGVLKCDKDTAKFCSRYVVLALHLSVGSKSPTKIFRLVDEKLQRLWIMFCASQRALASR